jgi:hypothetical protein
VSAWLSAAAAAPAEAALVLRFFPAAHTASMLGSQLSASAGSVLQLTSMHICLCELTVHLACHSRNSNSNSNSNSVTLSRSYCEVALPRPQPERQDPDTGPPEAACC